VRFDLPNNARPDSDLGVELSVWGIGSSWIVNTAWIVSERFIGNFVYGRIQYYDRFGVRGQWAVFSYLLILMRLSKQCANKSRLVPMWHNGCTSLVGTSLPITVIVYFQRFLNFF
jgi:hypothetical protein